MSDLDEKPSGEPEVRSDALFTVGLSDAERERLAILAEECGFLTCDQWRINN